MGSQNSRTSSSGAATARSTRVSITASRSRTPRARMSPSTWLTDSRSLVPTRPCFPRTRSTSCTRAQRARCATSTASPQAPCAMPRAESARPWTVPQSSAYSLGAFPSAESGNLATQDGHRYQDAQSSWSRWPLLLRALRRPTTTTIITTLPRALENDVHRDGSPERAISMDIILLGHEATNQPSS